jgi:hypothetical protein
MRMGARRPCVRRSDRVFDVVLATLVLIMNARKWITAGIVLIFTSSANACSSSGGGDGNGTATTATFLMTQQCESGNDPTATLTVSIQGSVITVDRENSSDGNNCLYAGTISDDCTTASGTYECEGTPAGSWAATIVGSGDGAQCTVGTTWAEEEADCLATWTLEG